MKPGQFEKDIRLIWPNIRQTSCSSFGVNNLEVREINANIELRQLFLNDSGFGPKQRYLIHYTSIPSLIEIIGSGRLRLHNLHNFNDPSEMDFTKDLCNIQGHNDLIKSAKDHVFAFCFAGLNNPTDEDFTLWRLYGKEGFGAAIVFEIKNYDSLASMDFVLGSVNYEITEPLKLRIKETFELLYKHRNQGVNAESIPDFFKVLLSLCKDPRWSIEKEIRLMTVIEHNPSKEVENCPGLPAIVETLRQKLGPRSELAAFVEYPIFGSNFYKDISNKYSWYPHNFPQLQINSIIAGPFVTNRNFGNLKQIVLRNGLNTFESFFDLKKSIFENHTFS